MAPATACRTHRSSHVIICEPFTSPVLYGSAGGRTRGSQRRRVFSSFPRKPRGLKEELTVKDLCRRKGLAVVGRKKGGDSSCSQRKNSGSLASLLHPFLSHSLSQGRKQSPSCTCSRGPLGMAPRWAALCELLFSS